MWFRRCYIPRSEMSVNEQPQYGSTILPSLAMQIKAYMLEVRRPCTSNLVRNYLEQSLDHHLGTVLLFRE